MATMRQWLDYKGEDAVRRALHELEEIAHDRGAPGEAERHLEFLSGSGNPNLGENIVRFRSGLKRTRKDLAMGLHFMVRAVDGMRLAIKLALAPVDDDRPT